MLESIFYHFMIHIILAILREITQKFANFSLKTIVSFTKFTVHLKLWRVKSRLHAMQVNFDHDQLPNIFSVANFVFVI